MTTTSAQLKRIINRANAGELQSFVNETGYYFDPQYCEVDRVIASTDCPGDIEPWQTSMFQPEATFYHSLTAHGEHKSIDDSHHNEPPVESGIDHVMYLVKWCGRPYRECTWELDTFIDSIAKQAIEE